MRVGIFSDSHGDSEALDELLGKMGHIDAACFLGDVARDADHLEMRLSGMPGCPPLFAVRGNNDYYSCSLPWERTVELGGVGIYMTHGHRAAGLMGLVYKAQETQAKIALFGHTHQPYCAFEQGVMLLNPGSAGNYCRGGRARASVLEISKGKFKVQNILT